MLEALCGIGSEPKMKSKKSAAKKPIPKPLPSLKPSLGESQADFEERMFGPSFQQFVVRLPCDVVRVADGKTTAEYVEIEVREQTTKDAAKRVFEFLGYHCK